ncbi:MAG: ABC transporter ATP-binding protein [Bacteroidetes bacterium]|nr:MAG: ABC transporter ATP-binding protein [Bacteroidota bacterium]
MIKAEGLHKSYGNHVALHHLDLEVKAGSIFGLLGPNGAGKTSFIRIINQITAPDSGQLFFNGEKLSASHIKKIGYLPEERGLYPKMKVGEQLLYLAQLKEVEKSQAKERILKWLKDFQLMDWKDKNVEELSKGMAQKVQFIATLLHQPELLILDEPFTGFDPRNTEIIKKEIQRLGEMGTTIIFSTHRMESVEEICDSIVLINKGKKVLEGSLRDIKQQFRSGNYDLILEESEISTWPAGIEILSQASLQGKLHLKLKLEPENKQSLLQFLSTKNLHLFQEEEAKLHDIFIQTTAEE